MLKALKRMPVFLAVIIMALLMLSGVVLGNGNALDAASATAWRELAAIQRTVADMSGRAANHQAIAGRLGIQGEAADALVAAQRDANAMAASPVQSLGASAPQRIVETADALNQALVAMDAKIRQAIKALSDPSAAKIEEDARSRAYDNWMDNRLGVEQRKLYNATAQSVQAVYDALPARMLLTGKLPPVFE